MSLARHALTIPAILFAGCVTTDTQSNLREKIAPEILAAHESRLVEQFRGGNVVVCESLVIEANLFMFTNNVTLPASKPRRVRNDLFEQLTWSVDDTVELTEKRSGATPAAEIKPRPRRRQAKIDKFRIMVGSTTFIVDDRITVRRLFRAPPTLTAHAKGHVMVIRNGKDSSNFQEVRFVDGRVEAR
jgi:hypothetical protein